MARRVSPSALPMWRRPDDVREGEEARAHARLRFTARSSARPGRWRVSGVRGGKEMQSDDASSSGRGGGRAERHLERRVEPARLRVRDVHPEPARPPRHRLPDPPHAFA
jgi:hypothetical protein